MSKTTKTYSIVIILFTILILMVLGRENYPGQGGQLFFQVHFASSLKDITPKEAHSVLQGKIPGRLRNLKISNIYVDETITESFKLKYPDVIFRSCRTGESPPDKDKGALLISDLTGLIPSMKIISCDNHYPWGLNRPDYGISEKGEYPLTLSGALPWQPKKHRIIVQTGVTAMTRAFMRSVQKHGDLYRPVKQVRHIIESADLSLTSNEVSFTSPCTYPLKNRMLFCSPEKYFNILTHAGFDVIELTGNHNNDYGRGPNLNTISLIKNSGMNYFGGGINRRDAYSIKPVKIGGLAFVFIGFNQWGPPAAWATENGPGAARLSKKRFIAGIKKALEVGDIIFVSVQWGNENNPVPDRTQIEYFHLAADLGAHIMVSSSAHRAMGVEFYRGKFISYGLGNFLFDQMQTINHRRGLIARHHFYQNNHIETELIPYLMYNYSEPHLISGASAKNLFRYIFRYSRGPVFDAK